jgi:hypothetical protein
MEFPMRNALGCLAAAILAAGVLALPAGPASANGTLSNHPDVRIFTPTPLAARPPAPQIAVTQPVKVVVNIAAGGFALDPYYRRALAWEYRKDRIHRAFGHRYTGFIKMYRGPRYPF